MTRALVLRHQVFELHQKSNLDISLHDLIACQLLGYLCISTINNTLMNRNVAILSLILIIVCLVHKVR